MIAATFDCETRRLASDLQHGWKALLDGEGGISALVVWVSSPGRPYIYDDNTLEDAASTLENADVVLSFNGVTFDVPLIEGHYSRKLKLKCHLDLYQAIKEAVALQGGPRKGYTLEECARRTLGRGKSGVGSNAPTLSEQGRHAELFQYCLDDVLLTRDLFKFAQTEGGVIGINGDLLPLSFPAWFAGLEI